MPQPTGVFSAAERAECLRLIDWGLQEDLGERGDITSSAVVPNGHCCSAAVVVRSDGVVAGVESWSLLAERFGGFEVDIQRGDGPALAGDRIAVLRGSTRAILACERLGLNLVSRLSGVASLTARYVAAVAGTGVVVCDTRKTTPGYRRLEKYAVRVGGGTNHRLALFDGVLIKDNHLAALREAASTGAAIIQKPAESPVAAAVALAKDALGSGEVVEIEVDSLSQLHDALRAGPDIVLLDNMTIENLTVAVEMRNMTAPKILLEASGGVTLETVARIARTGVDRISVGAMTHSAVALDLALDYLFENAGAVGVK